MFKTYVMNNIKIFVSSYTLLDKDYAFEILLVIHLQTVQKHIVKLHEVLNYINIILLKRRHWGKFA